MNIVKVIDAYKYREPLQKWISEWCDRVGGDDNIGRYIGFFCLEGFNV